MKPKKLRRPKFPKRDVIIQGPLAFWGGSSTHQHILYSDLKFFQYLGTKDRAKLLKWFVAMDEYLQLKEKTGDK